METVSTFVVILLVLTTATAILYFYEHCTQCFVVSDFEFTNDMMHVINSYRY